MGKSLKKLHHAKRGGGESFWVEGSERLRGGGGVTRGDWGDWVGKQEDGLAGGSLLVLEGLDGVNGRTWSRRPVSPCGQTPGDHPRTPGSYRRTLSYQWFSLLSFFHPRSFCLFRVPKSCR